MPREIAWLLFPAVVVWITALAFLPVREAYLNGWRCLCRHHVLWKTPAWFALAYGAFQFADFLLLSWRTGTTPPLGLWTPPAGLLSPVQSSLFPATESLAAIFTCLTATFPVSALLALLFLLNYRGLTAELFRAVAKTFGWKVWLLFPGLLLCAFCALIKPLLLLALPELMDRLPFIELMIGSTLANALSFVFEYLLGTCLQVFLLLVALGWVRGSEFNPEKLMHFAVRRLGFVFKWSLVIIATALALLQAPMLAGFLFTGMVSPACTETLARMILAGLMLVLAGVQIRLVLHNESLGRAVRAHLQLLRQRGLVFSLFLLTAYTLVLPGKIFEQVAEIGFGESLLGQAALILGQVVGLIFGGWILASWVCFYKSCQAKTPAIAF